MKKLYIINLLALILLAFSACKKDDAVQANLDAIDRNQSAKTDLDKWLDANFVTPYNIEVKYRWDPFELDVSKDMTPPKEEQVQPAMQTVTDVWIRPYEKVGGANFMKIYTPKQFVLVGSPEFNSDGTITLGTAEGGRKIVLYIINYFDHTNPGNVKQMIQVIQHEFTHILNQKVAFDPNFGLITKGDYTANWYNFGLDEARSKGFITEYSRSNPVEDFAEMVANMLMMGSYEYNNIVNNLPADPQAKLREKEQYVVTYFQNAFNIDFYQLQTEVQAAVKATAPVILANSFGPGSLYTTFDATPDSEPQAASFKSAWDAANNSLINGPYGLNLTGYQFMFQGDDKVTVRYFFSQGADDYAADMDCNMVYSDRTGGLLKIVPAATQGQGDTYDYMSLILDDMKPVDDYFLNLPLHVDWAPGIVPGSEGAKGVKAVFRKVSDTNSYLIGTLN